ncbi:MAG: hypothetical protein K8S94_08515 [Planctomycetia bacterium]|nr:hypothetical protein [Planctomycetia bacterium]
MGALVAQAARARMAMSGGWFGARRGHVDAGDAVAESAGECGAAADEFVESVVSDRHARLRAAAARTGTEALIGTQAADCVALMTLAVDRVRTARRDLRDLDSSWIATPLWRTVIRGFAIFLSPANRGPVNSMCHTAPT